MERVNHTPPDLSDVWLPAGESWPVRVPPVAPYPDRVRHWVRSSWLLSAVAVSALINIFCTLLLAHNPAAWLVLALLLPLVLLPPCWVQMSDAQRRARRRFVGLGCGGALVGLGVVAFAGLLALVPALVVGVVAWMAAEAS